MTGFLKHALKIDANLSARIVGCEFEAQLKYLVDPDERQRDRKIREFKDSLFPRSEKWGELYAMVEYVVAKNLCRVPPDDLRVTRTLHNDAMHMRRDLNKHRTGKSDVEKMIRVTGELPEQSRSQQ